MWPRGWWSGREGRPVSPGENSFARRVGVIEIVDAEIGNDQVDRSSGKSSVETSARRCERCEGPETRLCESTAASQPPKDRRRSRFAFRPQRCASSMVMNPVPAPTSSIVIPGRSVPVPGAADRTVRTRAAVRRTDRRIRGIGNRLGRDNSRSFFREQGLYCSLASRASRQNRRNYWKKKAGM